MSNLHTLSEYVIRQRLHFFDTDKLRRSYGGYIREMRAELIRRQQLDAARRWQPTE